MASAAITNELPRHIAEGLHLVPQHMQGGIRRYLLNGIPPGGFLTAVLENNLMEAFGRADAVNRAAMFGWCQFIYGYAPAGCHGSPAKVSAWIESGGLVGREAA